MKLKNKFGEFVLIKKAEKYAIDWDGPSRSKFQFNVKQFLKPFWKDHVVFEELTIPKTRLSLDFFNSTLRLAIEVQGSQHVKYNKFFHGKYRYNYLKQLKRDQSKFDFCEKFDIKLLEIYSEEELTKEFFEKNEIYL